MARSEFGKYATSFSSGCAATNAILCMFKAGDHIVSCDDLYGGTNRMFRHIFEKFGLTNSLVDFGNIENIENAINENTKAIFFETPTNPTLKCCYIEAIVKLDKKHNLITICDNTFCTPVL